MLAKKIILLFTTIIITAAFSACASGRRVIPVSKLEFGMTRKQVISLMDSKPDMDGDDYDIYLDRPSDLDARLNSCIFNYNGAKRLCSLFIESDYCKESEAEAMRGELMEKLDGLYSFSDDGWLPNDAKTGYSRVNFERKLAVMVRVNTDEDGCTASVTIMSDNHSEDENAENIPVIPKN